MGTHQPKRLPYRALQNVKVAIENQHAIRDCMARAMDIIQRDAATGTPTDLTIEARALVYEVGFLATDSAYRLSQVRETD